MSFCGLSKIDHGCISRWAFKIFNQPKWGFNLQKWRFQQAKLE